MTLRLTMLPARQGDALWIEWGERPWRMLVDLGTQATGKALRDRVLALKPDDRRFELLVVTHVDEDHIGGALSALVDGAPIDGFEFDDAWFNGWPHIRPVPKPSEYEAFSPVHGEQFTRWIVRRTWNRAFGGAAVAMTSGDRMQSTRLADGMTVTVLGPPRERLLAMADVWHAEVAAAVRKGRIEPLPDMPLPVAIEALGRAKPRAPNLNHEIDLQALADQSGALDDGKANGTSIALLIEYRGVRILLGADAYAGDLVGAIRALSNGARLRLDAFKVPHHGSMGNVTRELVDAVDCRDWLVSTDGTRFYHPDATAIARLIRYSTVRPCRLHFNVRSAYNDCWDNSAWRERFDYATVYGDAVNGLTWQAGV